MKCLNKAQVDTLFHREAVLFGTQDGVPNFCAAALFGEEAVRHASSVPSGSNGYGVGNFTLMYLTYRGFQAAASWFNVQLLREEAARA